VGAGQQVNEAVKRLALTKVIVAHRPETIASAGRVLVMEQAASRRICGRGRRRAEGPVEVAA
jgi:ABC-type bacteriocin/lantibiotic exporter with double-glycine peptidase domain